tara:strand:+ start:2803 stop:3009 length:207 start_codon:yes stop_codon:yes gene_type:complete
MSVQTIALAITPHIHSERAHGTNSMMSILGGCRKKKLITVKLISCFTKGADCILEKSYFENSYKNILG